MPLLAGAQSNTVVRVMAANLNGNTQSYQPFAIRIFQGLKPDVVCIQEFNYSNNTAADIRSFVDSAFGTNFVYYRETGSLQIPNGVISRYPIIASGRWVDTQVSNRGFAWARIDLPGTNDLYAVSVHLLTSSSSARATEAANLKALIQSNFPTNAWIVIAGDFNTSSRTESAITTLASLCPDSPIPTDAESGGNYNSNAGRTKPYDYVLASHSFTNRLTNVVFASHSFSRGLVFDSRVYTPLNDVSPVQSADSGLAQHMAVLKDFSVPVSGTNPPVVPVISQQPQSQTVAVGAVASFSVAAGGTAPLSYQWRYNGTNISGANTNLYLLLNAQTTNNGGYTVVITNIAGAVTSSVANLTVTNTPPAISAPPVSQTNYLGGTAVFSVEAVGTAPLVFQWRFNGTNIAGASDAIYSLNNLQATNAGDYAVVITNSLGSVTSSVAVLVVADPAPVIATPPASLTVNAGSPASFVVDADGLAPFDYQWRFNGADISGAITNPFALATAQTSDAGNYTVVVGNYVGSVTSAVAVLTVNAAATGTATNVVISQIYGGGGNSGATYRNDFVELFNPNSSAANLEGWAIQYASATGNTWSKTALSGAIQPYQYFLVMLSSNGAATVGISLPLANVTNTAMNISATVGKLALTTNNITLAGTNPVSDPAIVDFVGYGSSATGYEGTAPAAGGNNTTSILRKNGGLTDSNNNTNDFSTLTPPAPRNSASPANPPPSQPAAAPVLGTASISGGQLQFTVSGTAGSNYIVLCATNLSAASWTPLRTNPAPFTFTETNLVAPRRFYRAVVQ